MGGHALKTAHTRRYEKEEFEKIVPEIEQKLQIIFEEVYMPRYYSEKKSFGDADFLCKVGNVSTNFTVEEFVTKFMGATEVFKNGNVYSFDYNELQVDLILTGEDLWETSKIYFSYNDVNNLIGKLARRFGLKWGHDGLVYVYRMEGKVLGEIVVTKDYRKAYSFLGLDLETYDKGFRTLEDIFDFITSSKYFSPSIFDFELMNRNNRERDKKRQVYVAFLEHIKFLKDNESSYYYFYPDKKVYLGLIDRFFTGFLKDYLQLELLEERRQKVSSLFNGSMVMEKFGLTGSELGQQLLKFKNSFASKEEQEDYILQTNDTEKILERFKTTCEL